MSRQSSSPAPSTMPADGHPNTIPGKAAGAASSTTAVDDSVHEPSVRHSSTATDEGSNIAFRNLASHISSRNEWKFWSPARLAHRTQVKIQKCLESETGCYILVTGVPAAMVDSIENVFQPVNPSVQSVRLWLWTGGTADLDGCPGRTAVVASVLMVALDGPWGRQVS